MLVAAVDPSASQARLCFMAPVVVVAHGMAVAALVVMAVEALVAAVALQRRVARLIVAPAAAAAGTTAPVQLLVLAAPAL